MAKSYRVGCWVAWRYLCRPLRQNISSSKFEFYEQIIIKDLREIPENR